MFGGPSGSGKGKRASIYLFDEQNRTAGTIDFWDASFALPADAISEKGNITFSLHIERLENVVDMLRNESPIFIAWQESLKNAYIGTSQEQVGEGE